MSDSIAGVLFNSATSSGYDLTRTNPAVLTLTGYSSSAGTSNSTQAAIRGNNTSGTDTIDIPLTLAPFSGSVSTFYQLAGGSLVVNGAITGTSVNLSLSGTTGGFISLNGSNSSLTSVSVDANETVTLGNSNALGSGAFSVNSSATIQAGAGGYSVANPVSFTSGTPVIGGTNNITFSGAATVNAAAASRTLTVNNSALTTFSGNVYLAPDNTTAKTFTINGTGAVLMSGNIANNSGLNTVASSLSKGGTATLTLTATNTYTGSTSISGGTLSVGNAQHVSASIATSPTINLNTSTSSPASTTLVLFNSLALSANATLNVTTTNQTLTQTIDLDFNNATQSIASFVVDGSSIAPGIYPVGTTFAGGEAVLAADSGYSGGSLTVTPEPASISLMLGGLSAGLLKRRKRVSSVGK